VQRNKARKITALFDVVQTVDSAALADALDRGAADAGKTLDALIQVNVSGDERNGIAPESATELGRAIAAHAHLRLRGVMAVGPLDPTRSKAAFAQAKSAFDALAREQSGIDTLSMGMSDDLEAAVAAGSTMVRIGTALFGPRPTKGKG
jgi:pyridoxal phosphate enzyme (YggS family)